MLLQTPKSLYFVVNTLKAGVFNQMIVLVFRFRTNLKRLILLLIVKEIICLILSNYYYIYRVFFERFREKFSEIIAYL